MRPITPSPVASISSFSKLLQEAIQLAEKITQKYNAAADEPMAAASNFESVAQPTRKRPHTSLADYNSFAPSAPKRAQDTRKEAPLARSQLLLAKQAKGLCAQNSIDQQLLNGVPQEITINHAQLPDDFSTLSSSQSHNEHRLPQRGIPGLEQPTIPREILFKQPANAKTFHNKTS